MSRCRVTLAVLGKGLKMRNIRGLYERPSAEHHVEVKTSRLRGKLTFGFAYDDEGHGRTFRILKRNFRRTISV